MAAKTIAVHFRHNSWYISLPSSAKQQREMTQFCVDDDDDDDERCLKNVNRCVPNSVF